MPLGACVRRTSLCTSYHTLARPLYPHTSSKYLYSLLATRKSGPYIELSAPSRTQLRSFAWTRSPPESRSRLGSATSHAKSVQREKNRLTGQKGVEEEQVEEIPVEPIWDAAVNERHARVPIPGTEDGGGDVHPGLRKLLQNDTIVVVRQLEMMNIFLGYEQANRYALLDPLGNPIGYLAEEDRGFLGTLQRQIFRTHRPFRSTIFDTEGNQILQVYRPFAWINSQTKVQRHIIDDSTSRLELSEYESEPNANNEAMTVVGEVQQQWHPWRRRYSLFTGRDNHYTQFGAVDAPFLSWDFFLQNEVDTNVGSVRRSFTGFGREIFTDTGQYVLTFRPDPEAPSMRLLKSAEDVKSESSSDTSLDSEESQPMVYRRLGVDERATVLALSVTLDIDFFSRHSEGRGMGIPWIFFGSWGDE